MPLVPMNWSPDAVPYTQAINAGAERRDAGVYDQVPASWSMVEYAPDDVVRPCTATTKKGAPCMAARAGGTELCVGHGRSAAIAAAAAAAAESVDA